MLKKFMIERQVPGVGASASEDFQKMTGTSNEVLQRLGPDIQWRESFVTQDKVYCIYLAKDENMVREHARLGGFPADKISEIKTVLDPSGQANESFIPKEKMNSDRNLRS